MEEFCGNDPVTLEPFDYQNEDIIVIFDSVEMKKGECISRTDLIRIALESKVTFWKDRKKGVFRLPMSAVWVFHDQSNISFYNPKYRLFYRKFMGEISIGSQFGESNLHDVKEKVYTLLPIPKEKAEGFYESPRPSDEVISSKIKEIMTEFERKLKEEQQKDEKEKQARRMEGLQYEQDRLVRAGLSWDSDPAKRTQAFIVFSDLVKNGVRRMTDNDLRVALSTGFVSEDLLLDLALSLQIIGDIEFSQRIVRHIQTVDINVLSRYIDMIDLEDFVRKYHRKIFSGEKGEELLKLLPMYIQAYLGERYFSRNYLQTIGLKNPSPWHKMIYSSFIKKRCQSDKVPSDDLLKKAEECVQKVSEGIVDIDIAKKIILSYQ